jgi:hypothetical protein
MSTIKISNLPETTDLNRLAMSEVRGGSFGFGFAPFRLPGCNAAPPETEDLGPIDIRSGEHYM